MKGSAAPCHHFRSNHKSPHYFLLYPHHLCKTVDIRAQLLQLAWPWNPSFWHKYPNTLKEFYILFSFRSFGTSAAPIPESFSSKDISTCQYSPFEGPVQPNPVLANFLHRWPHKYTLMADNEHLEALRDIPLRGFDEMWGTSYLLSQTLS